LGQQLVVCYELRSKQNMVSGI